jgi:hypothetical protein
MKGSQLVMLACVLGLPLIVGAQPATPEKEISAAANLLGALVKGPGAKKGADAPGTSGPAASPATLTAPTIAQASSTTTSTSPLAFSKLSTSSTFFSTDATFSTTTNTIEVSSFMASSSSTPPYTSVAVGASYNDIHSSLSPASSSSSALSSSSHISDQHRTLIIVLSTVLGFVGLILIAAALFLVYRFGQGRSPFGHRSATPLDDDEIESWRGTVIEKKEPPPIDPAMLNRKGDSIQLTQSPGWTWTASPTSLRSALSPSTTVPDTPSFLAKAPNSRAGLTDETVPGADPFIPPMKRQSSRLSKAPPGHGRSKSRRSSMSAKSVWSYNGGIGPNTDSRGTNDKIPMWFDPDDQAVGKELARMGRTSSSPGTSIFDGVSVGGGLSPRPKSQGRPWEMDKEIGRAIA